MSVPKKRPAASEETRANDVQAPCQPTFTQNVIMTIKLLAAFGLLGAALWAIDLWITAW